MHDISEQVAKGMGGELPIAAEPLRISVTDDLEGSASVWNACEASHVTSPYQRLGFCRAYAGTFGRAEGTEPCLVMAWGAGDQPAFLLPLEIRRVGPARIARPLGARHVNFTVPIFDPLRCAEFGRPELAQILDAAGQAAGIDTFVLPHVPLTWSGHANPLAHLPSQVSANIAVRDALGPEVDATWQRLRGSAGLRKLRSKWRKLEETGKVTHLVAASAEDRARVLDAFLRQKASWFASRGRSNPFGSTCGRMFLEALAADPACGFELHALTVADEIVATFGGAQHQGRYTTSINSYAAGDVARWSPGDLLLRELIAHAVRSGCHTFDLGVGAADYKRHWLSETEPMVDIVWGVGALGTMTAAAVVLGLTAKRAWKNRRKPDNA